MTIYQIKKMTEYTAPAFFDRKTMSFFGQTMRGFKVIKQDDGRYCIRQKMRDRDGKDRGMTIRYFNPINNKLERE